jgi:lipopolysaccharide export system permease protein
MPYANKELRISRNNIQDNYANLAFNPQTFESLKELTIYARNRNEFNPLFGILLHDERSLDHSITITAKTGKIVAEDKSALLYMEDGTVQKFNYSDKKSEILNFDNYVFNLTENQKSSTKLRWKAKERYLHELLNPDNESEFESNKYRAEIHQRLTYPLLPITFSLIALGFILRGKFSRRGNLENIVLAILTSTSFLILTFITYDFIESSPNFIIFLYLNFALFTMFGIKLLDENSHATKK